MEHLLGTFLGDLFSHGPFFPGRICIPSGHSILLILGADWVGGGGGGGGRVVLGSMRARDGSLWHVLPSPWVRVTPYRHLLSMDLWVELRISDHV